ncbi:MAG: T9SS type A sorting domain-containing protein [Cyclobacteriaceae bacterium]|nr:T9SS type A sorting domain-containing protein [Cyclobacteriaceae bacterium]
MFKKLLILFITLSTATKTYSQSITNYTFSAFSGTFTTISGTTPGGTGNVDEGYFNPVPIGFDFWYMGTRYTEISASTNGWLALEVPITNATPANNLTSGGAPRPVLAPLWDNLNIQAPGNFTYATAGTAGSRVFTAQYLNVSWGSIAGNVMSFQVKLYEGTGRIEYAYRREAGTLFGASASIGISATATGSGQFLSVSNAGTSVSSTTEASITSKPVTDNNYRFAPPVPNTPVSLNFTALSTTSMTLNWSDLSSNETGFLIYRSTDGVNYTFVTQTAANATSSVQSGLTANTLYYWRIYAVSEGALSATPLSGGRSTLCNPPAAPIVTSPVNYCRGATASPLTATGSNLVWGGVSGVVGGTSTLNTSSVFIDNNLNNRRTNFTTTSANVRITNVDYYIPAFQSVTGLVVSIYNSSGTVIATSSTTTSLSANAAPIRISNTFDYTLTTAGNYSIGVSAGTGNVGSDNPTFPITEPTGTINITGVTSAGNRVFNNIQFVTASSSTAPTPSTGVTGSFTYFVSQTISGCTSPQASITVNVLAPDISQTPTNDLITNLKFSGNATDETGNNNGTFQNGPALTANRFNVASSAISLNGSSQYISTARSYVNPTNFSISIWFRTSSVTGGKLIGFGNAQTGSSGQYDRHLYMNNAGQIYFGVYPGSVQTINSTLSYNDNLWHHATATLSSTSGMALYVDGVLVGSNPAVTSAENYTGYWKIGFDNNNGWTSQPSSFYFNGTLDDAIIYNRALSAGEVSTIYTSPEGAGNNGPVCVGSPITLSATTVGGATYSWTGPGGFVSSSQNPTFNYTLASAGVYTVQVTVAGCSTSASTLVQTSTNAGQWTGNVSSDWATAGNWCTGVVPTNTTDVVITSGAAQMPVISTAVVCRNLTIQSGATLTTSAAGTLSIAGTLTNSGTMTNNGTTVFNGTTGQQTFNGVTTFNNLTLNNANGLLLPAPVTISNNLTLTAGILNANNFNIALGGNWTNNASTSALTAGTSTVTFNGTNAQAIGGFFATTFNNLTISNIGNTVTLGANTNVAGNLNIASGTFNLAGFTANRTSAGGTLTVANNATLRIGGTQGYPANYTTNTLVVASTVEYAGTNQTVASQTYGNLLLSSSSGAAVKTFPGSGFSIAGNLTTSVGSGTSVSFTAASALTIGGNVTLGTSTTFNGGSFTHTVGGNWINNGTFTGNTSTITLSGTGTTVGGSGAQNFHNLTVAASLVNFTAPTLTLSGNLATTGAGSFTQASGGTLTMTGTGTTISGTGISLDNLTVSGTVSTTASLALTGNLAVSGTFTASTGTLTMSGATKTISGAGTKSFSILAVTGSLTTAVNFSITSGLSVSGSFSASAGTATFAGTSSLSGTANLFNVTLNGTSLQLSANSTLGIANAFTVTAGTFNATSSAPNTVNFNGTGAQTVNALTYSNLILSNGNTKTAAGNLDIRGTLTIGTSTTFSASSFTHSVYGNWINNGTFTAGTSTVQFLGAATSYVTGATTFNTLTSNTTGASTELILQSNVSASTVNMTNGIIQTGTNTLTITNTRTGNGYIYGNIQRNHTFLNGTAYAFEGPNNTISFTTPVGITSVTVSVTFGSINDFPAGNSISRLYNVTIPAGTYLGYTHRIHYEDTELNGNNEATMGLWRANPGWASVSPVTQNTTSNYIEHTSALNNLAGRWTASGTASIVQWNGSVSTDWNTANNWTIIQGAASRPPAANDIAYIGTAAFTNQPAITNAVTVKNIVFGDVQAATLSLNSGGSLTASDVRGIWTTARTHAIQVNNQSITINGDLYLSDGTNGHVINLWVGTGSVTINGSLYQSGNASVIFSGAGNLTLTNDFSYTNGTFTAATSTVSYTGATNQTIGPVSYYNLTINKTGGLTSINNASTIGNNLTVTNGTLDIFAPTVIVGNVTIGSGGSIQNNNQLNVGGNWSNSGNYAGAGSTVYFDGTGSQNISATTFNNVIINKPVGTNAILTGNIVLNGDLTVTSGTLNIQTFNSNRSVLGGTATLANNGTIIIGANNPPINFASYSIAPASTVIFNGTGAQTLELPGISLGNLIFRNVGIKTLASSNTINGDLTIESGATLQGGSNTLTLNGHWFNSGTFIPETSTVLCAGISKNISGNTTFNRMTVTGSYTILNNVAFNGLLNITSSGSLVGGGSIHTTLHGDLINSGILNTAGTTTFSGNVLQTLSLINAVQTVAITVNFNGTVSPVLNSTSTPQYGFLNINNTSGVNPSVDWDIAFALTVGSGASFNAGTTTQSIYGSVTNNGTITSNGTIRLLANIPATINLGTNFTSTGLVIFGGNEAMTLAGASQLTFNNVTISNTHASGITPSSNWIVGRDIILNSGATFHANSRSYSVARNLLASGTLNSGTSAFTFNGTGTQEISTTSALHNIVVTNATGPITLLNNLTVNGSINFVAGKITTGNHNVIQPLSGSVLGAAQSSGWVNGNFQKEIATGASTRTFQVGNGVSYTPITLNFSSVSSSGLMTASTTTGDHPSLTNSSINPTRSVNRFWTLQNNGVVFTNYSATPTWVAADVDGGANTSAFKVGIYDGTSWILPTTVSPTATSIQATNLTLTGDIAVGEVCNAGTTIAYSASPYCSDGGNATVTLTGTSGGTFSSTTGLALNTSTGEIDLDASTAGSYVVVYTVAASGGCPAFITNTDVTITVAPSATIAYPGTPYCSSTGTAAITLIGSTGGTFSAISGLDLDPITGTVNLENSTPGTYNVFYDIEAGSGCAAFSTSTQITITLQPFASGTYEGNPYCSNDGIAFPTGFAVGLPGLLTSTPGLVIDPPTGVIDLAASTPGTYTVTYNVDAFGGCAAYSNTATVAITAAPSATISYVNTPFCTTVASAPVTFSGTPGGVFSSTAGLTIDPTTGTITPSTSTGGTYTVTYTMPAAEGCDEQIATTSVTITENPDATISYEGSPYSVGIGTATVTLNETTTPPSAGTYSSTPGLVLDTNTGEIDLLTSTANTYTVTYTIAASGGCLLYTTTADVTIINNIKVWDGGAGTNNWGDANNWSTDGVPAATDNIEISGAFSINVNVPAVGNRLTLNNPSLSLTVTSGNSLTISEDLIITSGTLTSNGTGIFLGGDWINNGTFIANTSTVTFNGTTTQQISGSSPTNFHNIHVTNTASPGVQIESNQNLWGVLTLSNNVILDADGSNNNTVLTLISGGDEPTNDAAIGALPAGAQVTGQVTVQRYMTRQGGNNQRIYRYISSPVQNGTVADIQNEIPVTGSFTGSSSCSGCLTNPSLFYYDETIISDSNGSGTADFNDGYVEFPDEDNSETFIPGLGYALFTRGNILPSTMWDLRGVINSGNIVPLTLPVSFTSSGSISDDGWNLVGNPFPSTIDWNASGGWTKSNIDGTIYISDNGSTTSLRYTTWNGTTGTNGGSRYIATGQGFWVKANGQGTPMLQVDENVKTPGTQTTFFRERTPENILRVTLEQGNTYDEAVIHFRKDATSNFDSHADAIKLMNGIFNLSSMMSDGTKLAINSLAPLACREEIKLVIENVVPGSYQLKFSELNSFPEGTKVQLQDKFTNQTIEIENDYSYSFKVTSNTASFGLGRFAIVIAEPPIPVVIQANDHILSVSFTEGIQWYFNGEPISGARGSSVEADKSGIYEVTISSNGCVYQGTIELFISEVISTRLLVQVYPNPADDELNIVLPEGIISGRAVITNVFGQVCGVYEIVGHRKLSLENLPSGAYTIKLSYGNHIITERLIKL